MLKDNSWLSLQRLPVSPRQMWTPDTCSEERKQVSQFLTEMFEKSKKIKTISC